MPYQGKLVVEDDAFELNVERLIVRDEEVAFNFVGADADSNGKYSIEGVSRRMRSGIYESRRLPVRYAGYTGEDLAVIRLSRVEETHARCEIEGEWRQDGECWMFSGPLQPFGS